MMSNSATPEWMLSNDWGVGLDSYNWILYKRAGKTWQAKGFYPTPEMLLQSLHRKLTRTEPPQPTLEQHVKRCLEAAQVQRKRDRQMLGVAFRRLRWRRSTTGGGWREQPRDPVTGRFVRG